MISMLHYFSFIHHYIHNRSIQSRFKKKSLYYDLNAIINTWVNPSLFFSQLHSASCMLVFLLKEKVAGQGRVPNYTKANKLYFLIKRYIINALSAAFVTKVGSTAS